MVVNEPNQRAQPRMRFVYEAIIPWMFTTQGYWTYTM